jgi:hypothetical protein
VGGKAGGSGYLLAPTAFPLYSAVNKNTGDITFNVPSGFVVDFALPIGPVIELCDGGASDGCGDDISTTTTPLMKPLPWATHHVAFIVFVAVRPICRR